MANAKTNKSAVFSQTVDFYWKSIAIYAVILIIYSLLFGSIEEGYFTLNTSNPIVLLLIIIIVASAVSLLYKLSRKRAIIIGEDFITFKSRFGEKKYSLNKIEQISFARERIFRTRRKYSVIKFKIAGRKRLIRVRPSAFDEESSLVAMLQALSKKVRHA